MLGWVGEYVVSLLIRALTCEAHWKESRQKNGRVEEIYL
jgi:hypothetical protein